MEKYDLIVIGAGSGLTVVSQAASMGMKVALVEKGPMGGTCLNRGCIPSKALLHAADIMTIIEDASRFGIDVKDVSVNFKKVMNWMRSVIEGDAEEIEESIRNDDNTTLYKARGKFIDSMTMEVDGEEITGNKIVIAAGAREHIPEIKGLKEAGFLTSTTLLENNEQPERLVIIGGGYVGCEFAYFFARLGTKVTIVQRAETLIPSEDKDIGKAFTDYMKKIMDVHTNTESHKIEKSKNHVIVHAHDESAGKDISIECDEILLAAGRVPNTDILQVDKTGVRTDDNGFIVVDGHMRTSNEKIWALGDIVGKYMFKHVANYQAELVTYNALMDKNYTMDYDKIPRAMFTYPQVAGVGLTEQQAREKGFNIKIGRYDYTKVGKAAAIGEQLGFGKSIIDSDSNKILGLHIIGRDASELVHEAIATMNSKDPTASTILRSIHIHPTLAEIMPGVVGNIVREGSDTA